MDERKDGQHDDEIKESGIENGAESVENNTASEDKKEEKSVIKDGRIEDIKEKLGIDGDIDTPEEAMAVLDGQVGFDEFLEQQVEESSTEETTVEEKAKIKKEAKEKIYQTAGLGKNVIQKPVETILHESMMPYSEHVILDRALPRVEDGLKPVQRRILYSMNELGVTPDKPYRKSARIVGDCLGKYHPHGDSSVYLAMVRMAQPFNMNCTLVDGHGNFGSVDGDSPAAMRYTEARMTPLALEVLKDLDKDTVDWQFNFDDTLKEPKTLPCKFPNLLVNGTTGIAVGLATNIPPHNLAEAISGAIAYMENEKITLKEMMKHIKGPDFPTGGYVVGGDELVKAYETGRGKIILRAKAHIEMGDNDKKSIVITELPYQVNKSTLLTKILDLRETKKTELAGISEICDESDRNGMRAVIRVKKDADPKQILELLYKWSDLQVSFGINMVAIAGGKPQQMGLLDIIRHYVNYQFDVLIRRTKFDLANAKEREHILEGLVIAVRNIDEVIKIIKSSQNTAEAKKRLMERFSLSDRQAQAILDMRLARLTHLEIFKLEEELKQVRELIKKLTAILGSKKLQVETIKEEMLDIKKRFKTPRVCAILDSFENFVVSSYDDKKPVENVVVALTKAGTVKCFGQKYFGSTNKEFAEKTNEYDIYRKIISTKTDKMVMFFTNLGNAFKMPVEDLLDSKWRGDKGTAFKTLFDEAKSNEYPVAVFEVPQAEKGEENLMFISSLGMLKKTAWKEYFLLKKVFQAAKFKDDDFLVDVQNEETDKKATICFVTEMGFVLNAFVDDIPLQGRISGGVKGINLSAGDKLVFCSQVLPDNQIAILTDKGFAKRVKVFSIEPMARYRKGVKGIEFNKIDNGTKVAFAGLVDRQVDIIIEDKTGARTCYSSETFVSEPRTGTGKSLLRGKAVLEVSSADKYINYLTN